MEKQNEKLEGGGVEEVGGDARVISTKPKKQSKLVRRRPYMVAIVVLVVLMLAGVGFGVYEAVMNVRIREDKSSMEARLELKDEELRRLEERSGMTTEVDDMKDESVVSVTAAKDYIYVGEWGIKIKVPEDAYGVVYHFIGDRLYVTARKGKGNRLPDFQQYAMEHVSGLGVLNRVWKKDTSAELGTSSSGTRTLAWQEQGIDGSVVSNVGEVVYEDENYYFVYSHPQALTGVEADRVLEEASAEMVRGMFRNGVSAF